MNPILKGRALSPGIAEGEVMVSTQPFNISSAFAIPLVSGARKLKVADRTHEWNNKEVLGKILVFPYTIGTTTLGFVLLETITRGIGPKAIVCERGEPLLSSGALCADIFYNIQFPIVDQMNLAHFRGLAPGTRIRVNGNDGTVEIL